MLDAAIGDRDALARMLSCDVADAWVVFPGALQAIRDGVAADPASTRWGPRFFILERPRTLVGWGGFKGPPQDGAVEIGYEVAAAWEGRGIATAAAGALVREAWQEPEVAQVVAHTLPQGGASPRVLEKHGFVHDGDSLDGDVGLVWRFRLDRR